MTSSHFYSFLYITAAVKTFNGFHSATFLSKIISSIPVQLLQYFITICKSQPHILHPSTLSCNLRAFLLSKNSPQIPYFHSSILPSHWKGADILLLFLVSWIFPTLFDYFKFHLSLIRKTPLESSFLFSPLFL